MPQYEVVQLSGNGSGQSAGVLTSQTHNSAKDAARDLADKLESRNRAIAENKSRLADGILEKKGVPAIEVYAIENGAKRALTSVETNTFKKLLTEAAEETAKHAGKFGLVGKAAGAVVAGTLAAAQGANAAEIGERSVDAVAPGLGTLALGQGPSHGKLCDAFGQASGALAAIGVGLGTSWTGPGAVAAGVVTDMAVTPAATALCRKLTM